MSIRMSGGVGIGTLGGPSSLNLSDLHDVGISNLQNGQYLRYNGTTLEWNNASFSNDALTPASLAATGTVTGSNLSGTNTGDQTITLTGDVSGSGTGTFATTLATVNASPQSNTFRKITVNGKGLVTSTSAVVAADITTALSYTPVNKAGDSMTGDLNMSGATVTGLADPIDGTDAVNKNYVDSSVSGLSWKSSVRAATTANITLSGTQTIDGVALVASNRVLVKNQTTTSQNGIYVVTGGTWVRSGDADTGAELSGASVYVEQGTQASTGWTQTADVVNVGTDPIVWAQFSGSGTYTAGTGVTLSGNTFSLVTPISPALGGTGTTTAPVAGQVSVGTSGGTFVPATITGTVNQVTVNSTSGSINVSLPNSVTIPGVMTAGSVTPTSATAPTKGLYGSGTNLQFSTASTERMQISSNGTVGIGITDLSAFGPGELYTKGNVSIGHGASTNVGVEIGNQRTADGVSYIDMHAAAGTADYDTRIVRQIGTNGDFAILNEGTGKLYLQQTGVGPVIFVTNSVERMRVDSNGNVGIAQSVPDSDLQIGGPFTGKRYKIHVSGNYNFDGAYLGNAGGNGGASLELIAHSGASNSSSWQLVHDSDVANGALLFRKSGVQTSYPNLDYTEMMRLSPTGNLGLNTTNPVTKIQISDKTNSGLATVNVDAFADDAPGGRGGFGINAYPERTIYSSNATRPDNTRNGWLLHGTSKTSPYESTNTFALSYVSTAGVTTHKMVFDSSGNAAIGAQINNSGALLNVGDTGISKRYGNSGDGTFNTAPTNVGSGGGLAIIRGYDGVSGGSYVRIYVYYSQVSGGSGGSGMTQIGTAGNGSASFTMDSSGGFLRITASGTNNGAWGVSFLGM